MATPMHALEVHPLTSDTFGDLVELFGEGGDPRWCWCMYFRARGRDWSNSTGDQNRAELRALTDRPAGVAPGLVGYEDGRAIAWISLGPREDYERLAYSKILAPVDDQPVWSIVCFVVSKRARGRGVAASMLQAGIAYAREHGATMLEAYPAETHDRRVPAADIYQGTLSLFERAGFEVVERRQWNPSTPVRPIVRRSLHAG
jgi:ribosomal protein S18 acetylase RimI-like enzyme